MELIAQEPGSHHPMVAMEPDTPTAPSMEEGVVQPMEPTVDKGCDKPDRVLSQPQITMFLIGRGQDTIPHAGTEPRAEVIQGGIQYGDRAEEGPIADLVKNDTFDGGGSAHIGGNVERTGEDGWIQGSSQEVEGYSDLRATTTPSVCPGGENRESEKATGGEDDIQGWGGGEQ